MQMFIWGTPIFSKPEGTYFIFQPKDAFVVNFVSSNLLLEMTFYQRKIHFVEPPLSNAIIV